MTGYARPRTTGELLDALQRPGARIVAGGTDLLPQMRLGLVRPDTLVSLRGVDELHQVRQVEGGLHIGAAVTLARVIREPWIAAHAPAVAEALAVVGAPQHREAGTIGGNLCVDTRCSWYNQSELWRAALGYCLRLGGSVCQVAPSSSRCHAVFSSDGVPALAVSRAHVALLSADGSREVPILDLYRADGARHLTLRAGEIITSIFLPQPAPGHASCYLKAAARASFDFPLLGVACAVQRKGESAASVSFVLGGVESCPVAVDFAEVTIPVDAGSTLLAELQRRAHPMENAFYGTTWRKRLVPVYARRCLKRLGVWGEAA